MRTGHTDFFLQKCAVALFVRNHLIIHLTWQHARTLEMGQKFNYMYENSKSAETILIIFFVCSDDDNNYVCVVFATLEINQSLSDWSCMLRKTHQKHQTICARRDVRCDGWPRFGTEGGRRLLVLLAVGVRVLVKKTLHVSRLVYVMRACNNSAQCCMHSLVR